MTSQLEIACPHCHWQNTDHERLWYCTCGHAWNTFNTCGQCPQCKKIWNSTQCPSCDMWSPMADWHVSLSSKLEKELKELKPRLRNRKVNSNSALFMPTPLSKTSPPARKPPRKN